MNLFGCQTDRSQERELFEKTNEEKMALFKEYKVLGNNAFKEKELDKASYYYKKVFKQNFVND